MMTDDRFRGLLFVLVGPGGVGKNTLMKSILPRLNNLYQLPTATTREPRIGEQHGREHLFVSLETFKSMLTGGELVEYEEVHPGKWYGMPRRTIEDALSCGNDLIADIEISGARKVHQAYPENTVLIFIAPPSIDVLVQRMQNRGESASGIQDRFNRVEREMRFIDQCKHVVVNDDFEKASEALYNVVMEERAVRDVRFSAVAAAQS